MVKDQKNNLKIAFAGGGSFAESIFSKLAEDFHDLTLISKEDKPKGRSRKSEKPKIKKIAGNKDIPIFEPKNKAELEEILKKISPDLVIIVSLGIIITENTLKIPAYGFLNVHFSLLPLHRGPSPVQSTILSGDKKSGFTVQKVVKEIDAGDIIYRQEVNLNGKETTENLGRNLSNIAANKISGVVMDYVEGKITPQKQDHSKATFSKIIKKSDGRIDWSKPAGKIERKVRAYTPWPSAYTFWNGKMLKILEAGVLNEDSGEKPGTFYKVSPEKYSIQTGNSILIIKKLQLEGKKPLAISDFILGNSKIIDSVLG
jgi:methionyl-tRNA formyltransferase